MTSDGTGHPSVRAWLDDHANLETGRTGDPTWAPGPAAPTLARITELVELLGSPQTSYPVVHVTGTNGKTSVARMVASLLAARGLSVGLYTSPHLQRVNERLAWNGRSVDDDDLDDVLEAVRRVEDMMPARPSYFEILTAAAFAWFADVAVDVAVVEVGLGGRWDATNVVTGDVAVITNVGLDHVEYLGADRASIATEKAGIVKEGSVLVLGETDPELAPIFEGAARPDRVYRRDADFGVRANRMAHNGRMLDLVSPGGVHDEVFVPLHGRHQGDNAAIALAAAEAFFGGAALEDDVVEEGFAAVRVPGRMEVVARQPLVMLDGAHNPAGAAALRDALAEEFASEERTLVVGMLREKDPAEMLSALGVGDASRLIACLPPSPRALDPEAVAAAARSLGIPPDSIEVTPSVGEAISRALATTAEHGQIIVTGSLYTAGAAREVLVRR
ncbi:MAG TPA: Mur ligase family protein [Acidimicrobiia bacterium]|nr:Mur ligase family protein [Acidimicrobiia bacterium]